MFMYLFTILNDKNLNVLVLSGGLFYSNNISFWLTKIAFQLVFADSQLFLRPLLSFKTLSLSLSIFRRCAATC